MLECTNTILLQIQDHYNDTIYCVEGRPYAVLLVFKITTVTGEGKVKIVLQNMLLPFGGNIDGGPGNK